MKKLILISLVIFFAICSRSWAGEINGKGIICEKNPERNGIFPKIKIYYFSARKAYSVPFLEDSINPIMKIQADFYEISANEISFYCNRFKFSLCKLDRKKLLLTLISKTDMNYGKINATYQCKVTDWSGILEHHKPALERHKEEMKKNKI
tara:strand:- start:757 stop:1209 length:453 start_codon:yes stop_codon:yes gene_type:complete